jgi:hypothetical protein
MTNPYPKVLVVADSSIRRAGNSGWTLYNLFRGWPVDRLAQIYWEQDPPDDSICGQSWKLSLEDVPLDRFLRRTLRLLGIGNIHGPDVLLLRDSDFGGPGCRSWNVTAKVHLKQAARAWMDWKASFRLNNRLLEWAREFHPDVIYCLSTPLRPIRLQNRLAAELGVPMLPHVMDDFMSQMYRHNWLENGPRQALKPCVGQQIRRCPFALAISPAMATEYARRFDKPFFSLMNCVGVPTSWAEPLAETGQTPLTVAYVGGVHLGRFESLLETAAVVKNLRAEGMRLEIVAYELREDQAQRAALEQTGTVKLAAPLPGQDTLRLRRLQEASVLLHLDALHGAAVTYSRLSLSTKLPFYLAAGRAILARAAAGLASIDYLAEHQAAATVTDPSPERLQETLRMLLTNKEMRHNLGRSAWRLARANHDGDGQRERFRLLLGAAAERRLPGSQFTATSAL